MTYLLITMPNNEHIIVAEQLASSFLSKLSLSLDTVPSIAIAGIDLLTSTYRHPLFPSEPEFPILPAPYVTAESGTGLVHSAPGHGAEDYHLCNTYGISPFSPVDAEGRFTDAVKLDSLKGQYVLGNGNQSVIELLLQSGSLLVQQEYKHKYPYDWRSKEPVIVRATEQWFANVEDVKNDAINALQNVKMIPESGISPSMLT
jgi:isoleucyl-tRNA synthetase